MDDARVPQHAERVQDLPHKELHQVQREPPERIALEQLEEVHVQLQGVGEAIIEASSQLSLVRST